MVLSSGYGQHQLHQWSRQAIQHQKKRSTSLEDTTSVHIPAYGTATRSKANPKIPDPGLFDFKPEASENDNTRLPSVAECAAHLELLEAFHHIYLKVSSSTALDNVLGIKPKKRTVYRKKYLGYRRGHSREEVKLRDTTFQERRKAKWPLYLTLAATRFLAWAEVAEKELEGLIPSKDSSLHLPPIDVLMVWHSLLLNPRWFRSFEGRPLKNLYAAPFPWKEIHKAIDADKMNFPYNLPTEAIVWFLEKTGLEPNLFEALIAKGNKSTKVQQLLERHGASGHHNTSQQGLAVEDIDAVLRAPGNLDRLEIRFLKCCRDAISKNSTGIKLVEAVQRQASFVEKMDKQLWIRSPAIEGTLSRAIDRYSKFLKLFKLYPNTMLVPTLDIDLVWHTHQCSPSRYEAGTVMMAGRLIDHDDKIGAGILNSGFTRTKDLYRIRFGQEYQVCNCWDCEALLSAISTQNSGTQPDKREIARYVHENVAYHRTVEIVRRKRHTQPPIRIQKLQGTDLSFVTPGRAVQERKHHEFKRAIDGR
ncbi:hypothetical protein OIDMADRAFT_139763 [Oidiodendron maius Zn]|uniref:Uncharacterized protein n=1 Tax=Oidiodendron maius (strain Zn) TaxID=913774 RepID=A0A0C3HG15_OIDMZ|nr:hypothetical protein OIDMADRAFT_139763 [Oidiodendron maius Zn]